MLKIDIWPKFECQKRTSNVQIRYSVSESFECQSRISYVKNSIFGLGLTVIRISTVKM